MVRGILNHRKKKLPQVQDKTVSWVEDEEFTGSNKIKISTHEAFLLFHSSLAISNQLQPQFATDVENLHEVHHGFLKSLRTVNVIAKRIRDDLDNLRGNDYDLDLNIKIDYEFTAVPKSNKGNVYNDGHGNTNSNLNALTQQSTNSSDSDFDYNQSVVTQQLQPKTVKQKSNHVNFDGSQIEQNKQKEKEKPTNKNKRSLKNIFKKEKVEILKEDTTTNEQQDQRKPFEYFNPQPNILQGYLKYYQLDKDDYECFSNSIPLDFLNDYPVETDTSKTTNTESEDTAFIFGDPTANVSTSYKINYRDQFSDSHTTSNSTSINEVELEGETQESENLTFNPKYSSTPTQFNQKRFDKTKIMEDGRKEKQHQSQKYNQKTSIKPNSDKSGRSNQKINKNQREQIPPKASTLKPFNHNILNQPQQTPFNKKLTNILGPNPQLTKVLETSPFYENMESDNESFENEPIQTKNKENRPLIGHSKKNKQNSKSYNPYDVRFAGRF
ncbi:uncharacterized protein KGF55_002050 [Candida pseudojiufengensis]|uniref:uncharacterized protein n=1 Tax=Candida pseudojiufengensis TaxID=497109 RepID=UPI002224E857|nr:uncharacterized protein KGF55_002050 [Candida pseudojiufengensis]KAI5964108.1 hypothetical protein KGF55_002050 [Candida pseudojiufengensis]